MGALSRFHSVFICHAIDVRIFNHLKTMLPSSQMDFNSLENIEGSPCPVVKFKQAQKSFFRWQKSKAERRLISISHANLLTQKGPSAIAWTVTALGGCQVSLILSWTLKSTYSWMQLPWETLCIQFVSGRKKYQDIMSVNSCPVPLRSGNHLKLRASC